MNQTTAIQVQATDFENIPVNRVVKSPLSVPLIAAYIQKGYTQAQIAALCNVSQAAVTQYISRHNDEFAPLIDKGDSGYLAMLCKQVAVKSMQKIDNVLELSEFTKKDLVALNMVSGTHTDKYRLYSDQSTQNISLHTSILDQAEQLERSARASQTQDVVVEPDK